MKKSLLILCLGLLFLPAAKSAHLIGGEITYTCLPGFKYVIELRMFRDCAGGGAPYDDPVNISIFENGNNLVQKMTIPLGKVRRVDYNPTDDPCVIIPSGLCASYTTYRDTVILPPKPGGYTIVHQRCCRNAIISNLVNPGDIGNTYSTKIPSMDTTCNSSPRFDSIIPSALCLKQKINLRINASDPDGDSISYGLCQIYKGGGTQGGSGCDAVVPDPPCPGPFQPVDWAGNFNEFNPLPAKPAFAINHSTGEITGKPTQTGTYVMGICLTEWRNGQPLSQVRLDYQFNIANCKDPVSDMLTAQEEPEILCDGLSVQFKSQVKNASSVLWKFDDPTATDDTSRDPNPTYTYPYLGRYNVKLIANPYTNCADTVVEEFHLKYLVDPKIITSGVFCYTGQDIQIGTVGPYPRNSSYEWRFGADADTSFATGLNPPRVTWDSPGYKPITFTVRWDSCSRSSTDSVFISNLGVTADAGPDQTIRPGDLIELKGSPGVKFYWYADEAVEMSNPFGRENQAFVDGENDTVRFYYRVEDALGCTGLDSMNVFVLEDPNKGIINVITPNGDGRNDVLNLKKINPDGDCRLSVLNRWGREVYAKSEYKNNWNGVDKGLNPLPDGTYYVRLFCDEQIIYQGGLTILRY